MTAILAWECKKQSSLAGHNPHSSQRKKKRTVRPVLFWPKAQHFKTIVIQRSPEETADFKREMDQ
jgi:hypothetical protein